MFRIFQVEFKCSSVPFQFYEIYQDDGIVHYHTCQRNDTHTRHQDHNVHLEYLDTQQHTDHGKYHRRHDDEGHQHGVELRYDDEENEQHCYDQRIGQKGHIRGLIFLLSREFISKAFRHIKSFQSFFQLGVDLIGIVTHIHVGVNGDDPVQVLAFDTSVSGRVIQVSYSRHGYLADLTGGLIAEGDAGIQQSTEVVPLIVFKAQHDGIIIFTFLVLRHFLAEQRRTQ